ncbi:TonB-dependent receptor [Hyphococcus luteus]|uniref:TonB-dependent receptor n=1 Tax=Hyphococcus luteus TaxID=2058213 RepID=UPI0013FD824F|nr:TonB-dependent receptor [Marinicaulis flavus]
MSVASAAAQEQTSPEESDKSYDTIVVTGRLREERLLDVPETIQLFSAEAIETAGIEGVDDLSLLVPNFSYISSQDAGLVALNIRGIGQVRNGEPSVAIVVDGVQLSSPDQIRQPFFDLKSIEVLKGPQGALYGRNAIGGAIIINTKPPSDEFETTVEAGVGNGNRKSAQFVASGPIVEGKLRFRVSGNWTEFDGLIDNVTLNEKADFEEGHNIRGRLIFDPTESLSIDLRGSYGRYYAGGNFVPLPNGEPNNTSIPVQSGINGDSTRYLRDASLKIDYKTTIGKITSVTSWSQTTVDLFEELGHGIPNPTLAAAQARRAEAISEDLRLSSPSDQRLRYTIGAYYLHNSPDLATTLYLLDPDLDPAVAIPVALNDNTTKAYAFYGQLNYDLLDNLELTLALRYDNQDVEQINDLAGGAVTDASFDAVQPKVSLAYKPTPDLLLYATYAEGFRSGGINPPSPVFPLIYQADETENYEIGLKVELLDGDASVNLSGFRTDYTHQAINALIGAYQGTTTIPKTKFYGAEASFTWRIAEGLDLIGGFGWLDGEIRDFDGTSLYVGNASPLSYRYSGNLSAQYTVPFESFEVISRVDYTHNRGLYWNVINEDKQDPVNLVNAKIIFDFDPFQFEVWSENLFNERYLQEVCAIEFCGGTTDIGWPNSPRRFGATARYKF